MAEEKKRRGRRAWLDDYKALANGQIVYTGKVYAWSGSKPWKKEIALLWLHGGAAIVCAAACGLMPVRSLTNTIYVILPWLLSFIGAGSVVWALCRMTHHGEELKEHIHKATAAALPVRAAFTAVCATITVLGQAVYLILNGLGAAPWADICFLPLMALAAVMTGFLFPRSRALPFALRP